jgi:ABC-type transporter Mla subunit MlaD
MRSVFMRLRLFVAAGLVALVGFSFTTVRVFADDDGSQTATPTTTSAKPAFNREAAEQKAKQAREKAQEELETKKSEAKERSTEERSKVCETRKSDADKRLTNRVNSAKKHKASFDGVLERIDAFVAKRNLNVDSLTTQRDAITAAATATSESVTELESLINGVDCSNPDSVASSLTTIKSQVEVVRDNLKEYRSAIKEYMQAVKGLVQSTATSKTEGGN